VLDGINMKRKLISSMAVSCLIIAGLAILFENPIAAQREGEEDD